MPEETFYALIHPENDHFVAYCPETGKISHGATSAEALANARTATEAEVRTRGLKPRDWQLSLANFQINCPD